MSRSFRKEGVNVSNPSGLFVGSEVWSYQHTDIVVSKNHTVLFDLPLPKKSELPKAHRAPPEWNLNHVRLPCAKENLIVVDKNGRKVSKSRWHLINETLRRPIRTSRDLEKAIRKYNKPHGSSWSFSALHKLINDIKPAEAKFFFERILPGIIDLALQQPLLIQCPIPLLKQGVNRSLSMSQQQAACLLANAFLCTFPQRSKNHSQYSDINFNQLYASSGQNIIEKLKCFLNYFHRVLFDYMPPGVITFQRRLGNAHFRWLNCDVKLSNTKFHISSEGRIEDGHGMLQVNFANRFVGGGVIGQGCVQEEIRFVTNPEMIIARLFTESLRHEEALIILGCEQFNRYTGYASSFQWVSDFTDRTPVDKYRRRKCRVVAIDALKYSNYYEQFAEEALRRELNKALIGFDKDIANDLMPVASGLWGCGASQGHSIRSVLIQLMACTVAQRNIALFTGGLQTKNEITDIYSFLAAVNVTVGQLYGLLIKYQTAGNPTDPTQLIPFIKKHYKSMQTSMKTKPINQVDKNKEKKKSCVIM